MKQRVRTAVIPAAGLGTRFLPVTRSVPKPLLPVLDTPLIHFSAQEAAAAGLERVILVISPGDEAVADYFRPQPHLEKALENRGDLVALERQRSISDLIDVQYVVQERALGLGHAVLMARDLVGDSPFAVLLPDDLIWSERPAIAQLIEVWRRVGGSVIAAKQVSDEAVPALGIIAGEPVDNQTWRVSGLVEKPALADAPSNLAIIGRYVLSPSVFRHLEEGKRGAGGEIQLTDAIAATLPNEQLHACMFEGAHIDAGTPPGMLAAAIYCARLDSCFHRRTQQMIRDADRAADA